MAAESKIAAGIDPVRDLTCMIVQKVQSADICDDRFILGQRSRHLLKPRRVVIIKAGPHAIAAQNGLKTPLDGPLIRREHGRTRSAR